MAVWNDIAIKNWGVNGGVSPYDPKMINPASLDLKLGDTIRIPHPIWSTLSREATIHLHSLGFLSQLPKWSEPIVFDEWLLHPGDFVLCASLEFVNVPEDVAMLLFSKSSTGRVGLEHLHAGFGDPGWGSTVNPLGTYGSRWTWELHNVAPWPIPLIAGKPLMQQVAIRMTDPPLHNYAETGRYNGQTGPTPELPKR